MGHTRTGPSADSWNSHGFGGEDWRNDHISMGDLQDPTDGGTFVPFFRPYFLGIFPYIGLKNRPLGTSNLGFWNGH